ncbi:tRNA preQ1(34) S-adenosylmethionine ribosyltransferase-isomerase QueA [bacterium]|nr:tRNA preQ1(34) S-adenosylmethionine ribosyltransferase-isomerase QueA [bacterium]
MKKLSDYDYDLPAELIAQVPLENRSDSRLLVVNSARRQHMNVSDLPSLLARGDRLVFNNTRVVPARVYGHKASGGKLELMLERITDTGSVLAKIRASKSPKPGSVIVLRGSDSASIEAIVTARHDDMFELANTDSATQSLAEFIEQHGEIPLPPYIERSPDQNDAERYQTVYAVQPGAVAAPTAGLHFDQPLFDALAERGVDHSFITLHVGAGTFQPVRIKDVSKHLMHAERVEVTQQAVDEIHATHNAGGRIIAVGTTCVRSLEAAAARSGQLAAFNEETQLFITPGYQFNVTDAMLTNFHLPQSTLLMLVSAFAGLDNTLSAYREAVLQRYRFFSYGDAMLVWPGTDAEELR